jgi:serine/threonine protein kinase
MTGLSDAAVGRLRAAATWPEFRESRYLAVEEIGRGGMGTVYRVADRLLDRDVAVKIPNGFAQAAVAGRLELEAAVLARLEHPGIVPIHDVGHLVDGRLYYVMKLVQGRTLRAALADHPTLPERLGVFERVCEPVAFAHSRGLVHRDLKPDNIMVGPFGEVLVMDWGAALLTRTERRNAPGPVSAADDREAWIAVGTRGFMAPEQEGGGATPVDARADVFGLGAMLFLLLTGEEPSSDFIVSERLAARRDLPAALRAICARATVPDPAGRYPDVLSLVHDVRRYSAGLAVRAYPETLLERTRRFARTYRTALVLVAAYLVMRTLVALTAGR